MNQTFKKIALTGTLATLFVAFHPHSQVQAHEPTSILQKCESKSGKLQSILDRVQQKYSDQLAMKENYDKCHDKSHSKYEGGANAGKGPISGGVNGGHSKEYSKEANCQPR